MQQSNAIHANQHVSAWTDACRLVCALLVVLTYGGVRAHDEPITFQALVQREGDTSIKLVLDKTWPHFQRESNTLERKGWRLIDLETYVKKGVRKYCGVFHRGNGPRHIEINMTWQQLMREKDRRADHMHLADLDVIEKNGRLRFTAVWIAGTRDQRISFNLGQDQLESMDRRMNLRGRRAVDLEMYYKNGKRRYAAIWEKGAPRTTLILDKPWQSFHCFYHSLGGRGWSLNDLESDLDATVDIRKARARYSGIWVKAGGADTLMIKTDIDASIMGASPSPNGAGIGDRSFRKPLVLVDYERFLEHGHVASTHPLPADCDGPTSILSEKPTRAGHRTISNMAHEHPHAPSITTSHSGTLHSGGSGDDD